MEEDAENIPLINIDPTLKPYKDHFKYRIKRFADQEKLIEKHEGSLEEFALGNTMELMLHSFSHTLALSELLLSLSNIQFS